MTSTREFTLDKLTRQRLLARGVKLECEYPRCEDKRLLIDQEIVSVTQCSGYGTRTKHYHKKCRGKSYIQTGSESDRDIVMFIKDRGVVTTDELGEFLDESKEYAAQIVRPMFKAGLIFVVNLRVRRGAGAGGSIKYGGRTLFGDVGNKNLYYVEDDALIKYLIHALDLDAKLPSCRKTAITRQLRNLLPPEIFLELYETYTFQRTLPRGR